MTLLNILKFYLVAIFAALLVGCGSADKNITASSTAEEVYEQTCAGCHSGGFKGWMTSAPEVGDKESWKPLIAKGEDVLTKITIAGVGKMPAMGSCKKCTDEQIKAAVALMMARSQ